MSEAAGEFPWEIKAAVARTSGRSISDDQLKYLRDNLAIAVIDTVPHPSGRGRVTLYALGTAQLVARLQALVSPKTNLASATWTAWIEGHPVPAERSHDRLLKVAQRWDRQIVSIRKRAFDGKNQDAFSEAFLDAFDQNRRFYDPRVPPIRKLVGSKAFLTFIFRIVRLAFGHRLPRQPDLGQDAKKHPFGDSEIVITGLGFQRMLIDRVGNVPRPTKVDILDALDRVADGLAAGSLYSMVAAATDAERLAAAREVQSVKATNAFLYKSLAWLLGRHAFGRGNAARIFAEYDNDDDVRLTALWIAVRKQLLPDIEAVNAAHMTEAAEALYALSTQAQSVAEKTPELKQRIRFNMETQ